VVTAYTIAFAALILTAGALGDRFGAKRIFMAGFASHACLPQSRRSRLTASGHKPGHFAS
jgi:MFS family permease